MPRTAAAVARLSGPGELVAALPLLCGFVPHESVVVVCLDGRGRLGLTLRLDLPDEAQEEAVAAELAARVRHAGAERSWVVVVTERPGRPLPGLVERLCEQVDVVDAVLVRAGRWWSYLCADPACCPATGTPVPRSSARVERVRAASVLQGRAVLPSRADLVASLSPPPDGAERFAEVGAALEEERLRTGGAAVRGRLRRALEEALDGPVEETVELPLALDDLHLRDELLTWSLTREDAVLGLLLALARTTPRPYDAAVCAALAWVAYSRGEGATASVALDRALASDPAHGLALLLRQALDAQVLPAELRAVTAQTRDLLR